MSLDDLETFVVVRDASGRELGRVETTGCPWCSDTGVCAACHARAEAIRKPS